jgi:hypothetical protein
MAHIHGGSFVNTFPLRAGNELLKIWLVADWVLGVIDFQTRNGNELTRPRPGRRTSVWVEDSCLNGDTMYVQ